MKRKALSGNGSILKGSGSISIKRASSFELNFILHGDTAADAELKERISTAIVDSLRRDNMDDVLALSRWAHSVRMLEIRDTRALDWWLHRVASISMTTDSNRKTMMAELFRLFVASGADINAQSDWPILVHSVLCRSSFVLDLLLQEPALDMNITNCEGTTALIVAAHLNSPCSTEYAGKLLTRFYDIDFDKVDKDGKTAKASARGPILDMIEVAINVAMPHYRATIFTWLKHEDLANLPPVLSNIVLQFLFKNS